MSNTERAGMWIEGVSQGVLISIVPILFVTFAVITMFMIMNLPLKRLGGI